MVVVAGSVDAQIVAGVDQASFNRAGKKIQDFARDTGKKLDPIKKQKLEMNVANATLAVEKVRKQLKLVGNDVAKRKQLIIDTTKTQSNLTEAKRKLQNFRNTGDETASRFKTAFGGIGKSIATSLINPVTLAVGAIYGIGRAIKGAVDTFRQFEKVQKQVQSIAGASGATEQSLQALSQTAKQLGATTKFTATEVSELQLELVKLGFTADEVNGELTSSTLDVAAAFNNNLADAAKNTGAVLKIFGLDVSEAGRVNDVLAKSYANSALDLSKFSTAITKAGPVAKAFGFSLESTTALLGKLSDAGFDASSSGTAVRNILLNMADSSGDLAQALGGPVNNIDDLVNGLINLRGSLGEDGLAKTLELTDKRSVAAFNQFLNTAEGVRELDLALQNAGGTAKDMAEKQLDTLDGSLTLLKSAWDGVSNSIGNFFAPAIRAAADGISGILPAVDTLIPAVQELDEQIKILNEDFKAGIIVSEEDYFDALSKLELKKRDIISATEEETEANNILKESIEGVEDIIKQQEDSIADTRTEIALLSGDLANGKTETFLRGDATKKTQEHIDRLKGSLVTAEGALEKNIAASKKLKDQQKLNAFTTRDFTSAITELNSQRVDTSASRTEFKNYQSELIRTIKIQLDLAQGAIALAKTLGDEEAKKRAYLGARDLILSYKEAKSAQGDFTKEASKPPPGGGGSGSIKKTTNLIKEAKDELSELGFTAKEIDSILKDQTNNNKEGIEQVIDAVKDEIKATDILEKGLKDLGYTSEDVNQLMQDENIKTTDEAKDYLDVLKDSQKTLDDFAGDAEKKWESIGDAIEKSTDKIDKYNEKMEDLADKLTDIREEGPADVAKRLVEIDEKIKEKEKEIREAKPTNQKEVEELRETRKELEKLKAERAVGFGATTEEQRQLAKDRSEETETDRLIRENKEKEKAAIDEIAILEKKKEEELAIRRDLKDQRVAIEEAFTAAFQREIGKQIDIVNKLADARQAVNDAKAGISSASSGGSTTIDNSKTDNSKTITVTAQNSNSAQTQSLVRGLSPQ